MVGAKAHTMLEQRGAWHLVVVLVGVCAVGCGGGDDDSSAAQDAGSFGFTDASGSSDAGPGGSNIDLAKAICKAGLNHLKFEALCEYVSLDEEALTEMRQAGYYKIRCGIETAGDVIADKMTLGKKHAPEKLRSILM